MADLELQPGQVLHRLDKMAAGMDQMTSGTAAPFATCIYAVLDPASSSRGRCGCAG